MLEVLRSEKIELERLQSLSVKSKSRICDFYTHKKITEDKLMPLEAAAHTNEKGKLQKVFGL